MENSMPQVEFHRDVLADLERAINFEWILTNGLGGYASSTILGINTRKYHGLLIAAFNPPINRRVLLSKLDEQLLINGELYRLGANEFRDCIFPQGYEKIDHFSSSPFPTFTYKIGNVRLSKTIIIPYQKNATIVSYRILSPRKEKITLRVFPLINSRHFHSVTDRSRLGWSFTQKSSSRKTILLAGKPQSTLLLSSNAGRYVQERESWIERIFYRIDSAQETSCFDDCYNPGYFEVKLASKEEEAIFQIVAVANKSEEKTEETYASLFKTTENFHNLYQSESIRLIELLSKFHIQHPHVALQEWLKWLILAADSHIVDRLSTNTKTVIAGYHWFEDWGRDSLISLPGLTLVTGRFSLAREILLTFEHYCSNGVIPNRFPDEEGDKPAYNTVDATLWYFNAVLQYLKYSGDFDFVQKKLWSTLQYVIDYHIQGTINNIHLDNDGLIAHGSQLTWMDAMIDNNPTTPRKGKAVEIQALWYNALKTMELLATYFKHEDLAEKYRSAAKKTQKSFVEKFWNTGRSCLFDVIDEEARDTSLRPNQILAASLDFSMIDEMRQSAIVSLVHEKLWTAYGLRTLSPDDSRYRGIYFGDWAERNYAYHNGTVWPWLIGPFVTAFLKTKNFHAKWREYACQNFLAPLLEKQVIIAGLGTLSEVFDGDPPHSPRGCISQAWSVAEPLRAYVEDALLERPNFEKDVLGIISREKLNKTGDLLQTD